MTHGNVLVGQPKEAGLPAMLFLSFLCHGLAILIFIAAPAFLPHRKPQPFGGPSGSGGLNVMTVDFGRGMEVKPGPEKNEEEPAPAYFLKKLTEPEEAPLPSKLEFPDTDKKKKKEQPAAKETLNQRERKIEGPYGRGTDRSKEAGKTGSPGSGKFGVGTFGIGEGGPGGFGTGTGIAFPFPWYIENVLTKIELNWTKPYIVEEKPQEYYSVVYFVILRSGQVRGLQLEKSSGIPALDRSTESAVLGAAPFPPLPNQWTEPELAFRLTFKYTR
jgi:TonB family protein